MAVRLPVLILAAWLLGGGQFIFRVPSATNPIAAARQPAGNTSTQNTVWAAAGVEGGVPARPTKCTAGACVTLSGGTVTATTIQNALAAASSGEYVEVPSGSYSVAGFTFDESNVTLRGAGADSTKLTITSSLSGCSLSQQGAVKFCAGGSHIGTTDGGGPGPDHTANWTAGYSQGTTAITLDSTTGLTVGHILVLDQVDNCTDGGDLYPCADSTATHEGGGSYCRTQSSRCSTVEYHKVCNINGSTVTLCEGVYIPAFTSGQDPEAWWSDSGTMQHDSGIENMTLDFTAIQAAGIMIKDCINCWVTGTRLIYTDTVGSFIFHILGINVLHNTFSNNYLYGVNAEGTTRYPITVMGGSLNLIENNIFDTNNISLAADDPEAADVIAYNYTVNSLGFASNGPQPHAPGCWMNLYEGNDSGQIFFDNIHGLCFFVTMYRNLFSRCANQPLCNFAEAGSAMMLHANNRFFNALHNIMGSSTWVDYEDDAPGGVDGTTIWLMGAAGTHGCSAPCPTADSNVKRTTYRYCNWDNVTSSNDTGTNDATGTVTNSAEVPTGISNYPQTFVPSSCTSMPSSLFRSSKPSYFGSVTWPAIGVDVSSGNATNTGTTPTGGHANKIPARVCYEAATNDGAYPSSNPRIKAGVASNCATP